jgi:hypothetical protein
MTFTQLFCALMMHELIHMLDLAPHRHTALVIIPKPIGIILRQGSTSDNAVKPVQVRNPGRRFHHAYRSGRNAEPGVLYSFA